jgi:uncharacterized membrane protein YjgN (DUF898 family)
MKKRNILKKNLIILTVIALLMPVLILANNAVFAQDMEQAAKDLAKGAPISTPQQIFNILNKILQYVYTAFFIVAVIFILVAAFNFLTAKGDPEKIKGARSQILWAVVAIAIALISVGAANIILSFIKNQ